MIVQIFLLGYNLENSPDYNRFKKSLIPTVFDSHRNFVSEVSRVILIKVGVLTFHHWNNIFSLRICLISTKLVLCCAIIDFVKR